MVALIEKIVKCLVACISYVGNKLIEKYPLWLYLAASLGAVLLYSLLSCAHDHAATQALVGKTEYSGHSFLVFRTMDDKQTLAVVHDPDCVCHFVEPLEVEE